MSKPTPASVEVVTAAEASRADLSAAAQRITETIELIKGHEDAFEDATLEHRLLIGAEITRAQAVFGLTHAEAGSLKGKTEESLSRRDTLPGKPAAVTCSPLGFSNWLAKEIPALKRSTAIKYATAFQSLGLTAEDATPARIRAKIKDLRHFAGKSSLPMPTLASLYKASKPKPTNEPLQIEAPKDSPELRLQDAREAIHLWKEEFEALVRKGQLDDLDKPALEELKEFLLGARDRVNKRLR